MGSGWYHKLGPRSVATRIVLAVSAAIVAITGVSIFVGIGAIPSQIAPDLIYSSIVLLVGIWLVSTLGSIALKILQPKIGSRSFTVRNILSILGYAIVAIAALSFLGVSPSVALAGGTVTGLVLGLGAQLILSNFFSGLVILLTGFVKVGDDVRLLTASLPYQPASSQAYKYFSPDYISLGYRGTVLDVGLVYVVLRTDTGLELKVPNQIILSSGILDYRPTGFTERSLQVRYEFKIDHDPDIVLSRVREALSDLKQVRRIVINEQSDKEYYIVLIEFSLPFDEEWIVLKSEILRRLVKVDRELAKQP
jgi:small conductance mechanosensitive channel